MVLRIMVVFVSCSLATKSLKVNFRLQEGYGLLQSGPVMRWDQWLTKYIITVPFGVHG